MIGEKAGEQGNVMKPVIRGLALAGLLCFAAGAALAAEIATHTVQVIAYYGTPKYAPDFKHWDYVNPDAPKGGTVHFQSVGTYDSFNFYSPRGTPAFFSILTLMEPLMTKSGDEPATLYGLLAKSLTYPDDYSWAEFTLQPMAKWHDGTPITAEDVVFSVHTFQKALTPSLQGAVENIAKAEALGPRKVRFTFKPGATRAILIAAASLPVVPKHFWQGKDFSAPLVTPPLGGGPYKITDFQLGRSYTLERVKDYWAKDLPVRRGMYNYDKIIVDYFRDQTVALESFKAGQSDVRAEINVHEWAQGYNWPSIKDGQMKKTTLPYGASNPAFNYFFNLRKAKFQDARVREALLYAYDFAWIKKNLYYGLLIRPDSYFGAKDRAAAGHGLPSPAELKFLEPWRGKIPDRVFTKPVTVPDTGGTAEGLRRNLQIASQLLREAGYVNKGGHLVNGKTGEPLSFEIIETPGLTTSMGDTNNWIANLKLLGVDATVRQLDTSQFQQRLTAFDYDVVLDWWFQPSPGVPSTEQRNRLGSAAADIKGSANWSGIKNPAVDALIEDVIAAKDSESYLAAVRALDRVLMWNFYSVPAISGGGTGIFLGYWNCFGRPKIEAADGASYLSVWWIDPAKDKALAAARH